MRGATRWAAVALLTVALGPVAAAVDYKIVTASERGTYIRIGQDLAQYVAPDAGIDLEAVPSAGSVENVRRLRYEPGVKLALVQSDVYQGYLDMAGAGNRNAASMIRRLRVVLPLYNEEIYFVARADAPWTYVHEIRNAKINAGDVGSGTALTTSTLYRLLFGSALPEAGTTYLPNEAALVKLITDRSIDVVAIVAGQPAKLLADMKPEARQHVKLLKVDMDNAATKAALKTYFPATVRRASYPNLLDDDLPGLAVKAFLVTYDFDRAQTEERMRKFAQALCRNLPVLREKGHPKWREVDIALPELGRGWIYYPATQRELRQCLAPSKGLAPAATGAAARPARACTRQEQILGLCG
ncbi:MAG TPA: TAXI family TRAP transporter solute-binding subunit [Casimicrobiaceae bacterium]|nr:TAXI family TRAP transporter solute-binding subunit [Casimicrobiaceae bacterium]